MSTGAECEILEVESGKWYYLLEIITLDEDGNKERWGDWREEADCYGPFDSDESAIRHLEENHANPGGFWTRPLPPDQQRLNLDEDAVLSAKIAAARPGRSRSAMRWR